MTNTKRKRTKAIRKSRIECVQSHLNLIRFGKIIRFNHAAPFIAHNQLNVGNIFHTFYFVCIVVILRLSCANLNIFMRKFEWKRLILRKKTEFNLHLAEGVRLIFPYRFDCVITTGNRAQIIFDRKLKTKLDIAYATPNGEGKTIETCNKSLLPIQMPSVEFRFYCHLHFDFCQTKPRHHISLCSNANSKQFTINSIRSWCFFGVFAPREKLPTFFFVECHRKVFDFNDITHTLTQSHVNTQQQ